MDLYLNIQLFIYLLLYNNVIYKIFEILDEQLNRL